jgi:hypothetical protein
MIKLSPKERFFYGLICSERRVYEHWYTRFLLGWVDDVTAPPSTAAKSF